jgi:hypothetical protein
METAATPPFHHLVPVYLVSDAAAAVVHVLHAVEAVHADPHRHELVPPRPLQHYGALDEAIPVDIYVVVIRRNPHGESAAVLPLGSAQPLHSTAPQQVMTMSMSSRSSPPSQLEHRGGGGGVATAGDGGSSHLVLR